MTAKRFTLIECNGNIEDGCTQNVYDGGEDVFELLDLLNFLNDENEQLKTELKDCHKSNHEYYIDKDKLIRLCTRFNIDWKKELEE